MKYLISTALKYIKRQKLRSTLTFLCVTLSVFILGICGSFFSSILTTMKNEEVSIEGTWEVNISQIISDIDEQNFSAKPGSSAEAILFTEKHPAISDLAYKNYETISPSVFRDENDGRLKYFDIELDNGSFCRVSAVTQEKFYGNAELLSDRIDWKYNQNSFLTEFSADNAVILPTSFKELGYKEGDTITMTITPASGMIDISCKAVSETLENLKDKNLSDNITYVVADGDELPRPENHDGHIYTSSLVNYVLNEHDYAEIDFLDEKRGSSVTYSFVIDGFGEESDYLSLITPVTTDLGLNKFYADNAEILEGARYNSYPAAYIRMTDNIDFDDAFKMYCDDLGVPESNYYGYLSETAFFHEDLLALELKSAGAIVTLLPVIIIMLFLAFIAWAISRFVIDNAFEISVQERSSQFAALRIMGASKKQLCALVMTEGVFYCVTAIPIGLAVAFLLCKSSFASLNRVGFSSFEFSINPVITLICIALCILAIFISSYTSAIWAARKLSPAEALNFGKPQRRKHRTPRKRKTKKYRSSGAFMVSYTFKNIFRTKKRFLISTIAMSLGVLLFTFCSMIGIYAGGVLKKNLPSDGFDFMLDCGSNSDMQSAIDTFADSEYFSEFRVTVGAHYNTHNEDDLKTIQKLIGDGKLSEYLTVFLVNRADYEKYAEKITGVTYDEFVQSESAMIAELIRDENGMIKENHIDTYASYKDNEFKEPPSISLTDSISFKDTDIKILGSVAFSHLQDGLIIPVENCNKLLNLNENAFTYSNLFITVKNNNVYSKASDVIDSYVDSTSTASLFMNNYMTYTGLNAFIAAIIKIVLIFLTAIWLTGILSMTNSINTSVLNRQRELLMMRSVGMSKKQLLYTVVLESMLFSSVSTVIGTILGTGAFIFAVLVVLKSSGLLMTSAMIITIIAVILINIIISVLVALPGIKTLSKSMKQRI